MSSHGQGLSKNIRLLTIDKDTFVCVNSNHNAATLDYWAWKGVFSVEALSIADTVIRNLNDQVDNTISSVGLLTRSNNALQAQLVASNNTSSILRQNVDVLNIALARVGEERNSAKEMNRVLKDDLKKQRWKKWGWIIVGVAGGVVLASVTGI